MSRQKFPYCHDFAGASIMDLITKESHKYDISYPAAAALLRCCAAALLLLLLRCIKSLMVSLLFWHHMPYSDS
jgi:hypothetical protein